MSPSIIMFCLSVVAAIQAASAGSLQPCKLLTAAQVATVLPNHDGGMVTHSGGSLIKGVDAYQCSYSNTAADLLTVVLNVAENDERFSRIRPSPSSHKNDRHVDIGDGAWIYGEGDHIKVEVLKGRTVIDLDLMVPGAKSKSNALVELARTVTKNVP